VTTGKRTRNEVGNEVGKNGESSTIAAVKKAGKGVTKEKRGCGGGEVRKKVISTHVSPLAKKEGW